MGSKGQTSTTTQNQTYAPAGAGYITNALNQAQNASQLPFNIPQAPVAGFSQDQLSAFNTINNAQGIANPYIQQANSYFQQGAQPNISQFYNPMASAVTSQLNNIFGQQQAQNTGSLTQAAGGVGADRIAVGQANLANQQGLAAGQTLSGLYSTAANQALQEQSALQGAGYGTAALGSQALNSALTGAQAQLGTGGLQQQLSQAQLNAPYQQQLAQAAFPYQQAQFLAGITGALAPGLGGTSYGTGTSTTPGPSLFSQILGGAGVGTAALGASGAFGSNGWLGGSGKGSQPSTGTTSGGYSDSGQSLGYGYMGGNQYPALATGGEVPGYDDGGDVSNKPINAQKWMSNSYIPQGQTPQIQAHIPQLNLNPPQSSGGGGKGASQAIGDIAKVAAMFNRGGTANPYAQGGHTFEHRFPQGYADGGSPDDLDASAGAIAGIESGGERNPYASVGPATRSGDRAYGKYQIMGANIPQWTKEATGRAATPQEFLSNPQLQDQTFRNKFGQYSQKYGPEGAARAWFAGEGGMNDPNRRDVLGTSVADYARKFNQRFGGQGGQGQAGLPDIITRGTGRGMPASALGYDDEGGGGGGGGSFSDLGRSVVPNASAFGTGSMFRALGPLGAALAGATQPDILGPNWRKSVSPQVSPSDFAAAAARMEAGKPTGDQRFPSQPFDDKNPYDPQYFKDTAEGLEASKSGAPPMPRPRPAPVEGGGGGGGGAPVSSFTGDFADPSATFGTFGDSAPANAPPAGGGASPYRPEDSMRPNQQPYRPEDSMRPNQSPYRPEDSMQPPPGEQGPNINPAIGEAAAGLQPPRSPYDAMAQAPGPAGKKERFIDSPWAALMAASLGVLGGTSPFAGVNIGRGGLQGLQMLQQQRTAQLQEEKQEFEMHKPVQIGKNLYGQPIFATIDKDGKFLDTKSGKPIDMSQVGEADEAQIEGMARAISNYSQPGIASTRQFTPIGMAVMQRVHELNPQYDAKFYSEAQQTRNKFATGAQGDTIRSFNTAYRHLEVANQLIDALNNGDNKIISRVANLAKTEFGLSSAPLNFEAARQIVLDEVIKSIVGRNSALGDRKAAHELLDPATSGPLLHDVINRTLKPMMIDQLQGFKQQYESGTHGAKDFGDKLSPQVKGELDKAEQAEQQRLAAQGAGGAGAAPQGAAPAGAPAAQPGAAQPPVPGARLAPDKHWYIQQQNGKYLRVDP